MLVHTRLCDWCFGHFTSSKSPYSPDLQHFGNCFCSLHHMSGQSVCPICAPLQSKTEIWHTHTQRPQMSMIHWFILLSEETNRTGFQNVIWEIWDDEQRCSWGLCSSGTRHSLTEWSVPYGQNNVVISHLWVKCPVKNSFIQLFIPQKNKTIVSKMLVTNIGKHCGVIVSHLISHNAQCTTYLSPEAE